MGAARAWTSLAPAGRHKSLVLQGDGRLQLTHLPPADPPLRPHPPLNQLIPLSSSFLHPPDTGVREKRADNRHILQQPVVKQIQQPVAEVEHEELEQIEI